MRYGRDNTNYGLDRLQEIREEATDPVVIQDAQRDIDVFFFGIQKRRKSKKERRRERRKEKQRMREEEY
jgi:hypothetical protein